MNAKSEVIVVQRVVRPEERSQYIEIPFEMPAGVETLRVDYEVESHGEPRAVIDLGVRDGRRLRGWSGGARSGFTIGREKATPGYLPGELASGGWAVVHNAYKVPEQGCTITVTITLTFEAPLWLKGDLHAHTVHSDGSYTLEESAAIMEQLGCDFLAMTDHNAVSQNLAYPRTTGIVMIPGMEFTTNFGHSNFLGVVDPCDDFRVTGVADVRERLRVARERGARIVLNHPHCDHCPWEWGFDVDHDWVEVWNGPWTARNASTLAWWQEQLASGRRLVAVGGSDVHRPHPYVRHAMPCTWVLATSRTVDGILDGIGLGHVVVTYAPDGPFVELTCGSCGVGDAVPATVGGPERVVRLRAERLVAGDRVKVISGPGVQSEFVVERDGELDMTVAPPAGKGFLRVEIWRYFEIVDQTLMAALTNPIYFE